MSCLIIASLWQLWHLGIVPWIYEFEGQCSAVSDRADLDNVEKTVDDMEKGNIVASPAWTGMGFGWRMKNYINAVQQSHYEKIDL